MYSPQIEAGDVVRGGSILTIGTAICGLATSLPKDGAFNVDLAAGLFLAALGLWLAGRPSPRSGSVVAKIVGVALAIFAVAEKAFNRQLWPEAAVFFLLGCFVVAAAPAHLSGIRFRAAQLLALVVPLVTIGVVFCSGAAEVPSMFTIGGSVASLTAWGLLWMKTGRLSSPAAILSLIALLCLFAGIGSATLPRDRGRGGDEAGRLATKAMTVSGGMAGLMIMGGMLFLAIETRRRVALEERLREHSRKLERKLSAGTAESVALSGNSALFQEMHHRIKNNLQVISSLLRMQADVMKDPAAAAALTESHQRVLSMAMIHEQLYGRQSAGQIDFEEYTQKLVNELALSYGDQARRVTCRLDTEPVLLKIDQAIPLGLILNELVTNAFKYAYPDGRKGEVAVSLRGRKDDDPITLCVADQGVGLPDKFDWHESNSMGLPIVEILTQQLGGTMQVRPKPGASFTIAFAGEREKVEAAAAAARS